MPTHENAPFELHFGNEIAIEYIVAIYSMIIGVYCLIIGSRISRLTLFLATWPCVGILIYYVMMVNNVNDIASLVVSFVGGLIVAVAAGAVFPFGLLLGGWAVGIIMWTGWMTFFPNEAPDYANYILLAVPSFILGAIPALIVGAPSLIVISPIVGAFLFMQGIETFIHQGWAVMYVWYKWSNCVDVNLCYYAMIAPTVAAILGMLFQAVVYPWDRPEEPAFYLGPPLAVVDTTSTYVATKTEDPVVVNDASDHIIVMPGQNASTDTTVVGGPVAEDSIGGGAYNNTVVTAADDSAVVGAAPIIHDDNGSYAADAAAVGAAAAAGERAVTPHPHDGHVSVLYDEHGHARIVNDADIDRAHHSIRGRPSRSDKYTYEFNNPEHSLSEKPVAVEEETLIPRTSSEQPGMIAGTAAPTTTQVPADNFYNQTGTTQEELQSTDHVTTMRPIVSDSHVVTADTDTDNGMSATVPTTQRRNSVGDLIRRFEQPK